MDGAQSDGGGAEEGRLGQGQHAVQDRPRQTGGHDVRDGPRQAERAAGGEAFHRKDEDVEPGDRHAESQGLGSPLRPEVPVVPGEHGEGGERGADRGRPGPASRGDGGEQGLRREQRQEGGRAVRARGEADRREASRRDGQARHHTAGKGPGGSPESQQQGATHDPRGGEAEALGTIVRGRPGHVGHGHGRHRDQRDDLAEGAGRPQRREGEAERQDEERLRPVGADRQLRQAEDGDEQGPRVPRRPLLARRARREERGERHEPARRHLEPLRPEVGRVPGGVQQQGPEDGDRRRFGPGLAPVQPQRPGAEEQQVGEEAHRAVRAGREEHRRQVAADPGQAREQARVEALGHEDGAGGDRDHEGGRHASRHEGVHRVGGEGRDVEAREAGGGEALSERAVLAPDDPQAQRHEAQAEHGGAQHAPRGADPVVLPRVAHEEAEEDDEREAPGADEDLRPEARGEVRGGGRPGRRRARRRGHLRRPRGRGGHGGPRGQRRQGGHRRSGRPRGRGLSPRGLQPLPHLLELAQRLVRARERDQRHDRHREQEGGDPQGEETDQRLHAHILPCGQTEPPASVSPTGEPCRSSARSARAAPASPRSGPRGA